MKQNIKKKFIISSAIALIILGAAGGANSSVMAADNNGAGDGLFRMFRGGPKLELTDAQKADMKAKTDAINTALDANDYNAWVVAVTAVNIKSPLLTKINSGNFSTYAGAEKQIEQAKATLAGLGVGGPEMGGRGMGFGMTSGGRGHGGPNFKEGCNADTSSVQ
jgi:hypothetical protein